MAMECEPTAILRQVETRSILRLTSESMEVTRAVDHPFAGWPRDAPKAFSISYVGRRIDPNLCPVEASQNHLSDTPYLPALTMACMSPPGQLESSSRMTGRS